MSITIKECLTDEEILSTFAVMQQLRPTLVKASYLEQVRICMQDGYRLVALYKDDQCMTVAGYRVQHTLFRSGNAELYVNDLVTDHEQRSMSYGDQMMRYLKNQVKLLNCVAMTLDSGLQRKKAHRFYKRQGMVTTSFHFTRSPSPPTVRAPENKQMSEPPHSAHRQEF